MNEIINKPLCFVFIKSVIAIVLTLFSNYSYMRVIVIKSTMYNMICVRNIKLILTTNCYLKIYKFFLKLL